MNYFKNQEEDKEKQTKILEQFRDKLKDISADAYSDEYLLRWLNAFSFDIEKSKTAFYRNIRARDLCQINTITEDYKIKPLLDESEYDTFLGFDKDNIPVVYITLSNADLNGMLHAFSSLEFIMYCAYKLELLRKFQGELDKEMQNQRDPFITVIMDFNKFSWQSVVNRIVIECGMDLFRLFQEFYPGLLNRAIVINTPLYFSALFNIFKPVFKAGMLEKIIICDKSSSPSTLLKFIDAKILPVFLGGSRVDKYEDPLCASFMKFGMFIPEKEYLIHQPKLDISEPNVMQITVHARSLENIRINVDKPHSKLHVEFWSSGTVGFHICYKTDSDKLHVNLVNSDSEVNESVSAYFKIFGHISPVNHAFHCKRTGTYLLQFDNCFSWISSKLVVYRITVISPS